jgi:hypothetical protein
MCLAGLVLGSHLSLDAAALVWRFLVEAEQSGGPAWEEDVPLQVVLLMQEAQGLFEAAVQYFYNMWVIHGRGVDAVGAMRKMREKSDQEQQQQQQDQQQEQESQQQQRHYQQHNQQQQFQGDVPSKEEVPGLMFTLQDVLPLMKLLKDRVSRNHKQTSKLWQPLRAAKLKYQTHEL